MTFETDASIKLWTF